MGSTLERYADIKLICDKIEKAAVIRGKRGDRTSLKVAALNSVLSLDQLTFASTKALEATQKSNTSPQPKRMQDEKEAKAYEVKNQKWEFTEENRVCLKKDEEWVAEGYSPKGGFGFEFNPFNAVGRDQEKAIKDLLGLDEGDDLAEGWENCFNCDPRVKFDFQLQPVNLLAQIDELLNNIQSTIDYWETQSSPEAYMQRLCELFNAFREVIFVKDGELKVTICIQDWISMLLGLQALMGKYANMSLSISLDWTVLFGPLLKLIIDAVATLIEQVVQLLTAPIDCAIGVLTTVDELYSELDATFQLAKAAVDVVKPGGDGATDLGIFGDWEADGRKMEVGWFKGSNKGGVKIGDKEQGIIPKAGKESDPDSTIPPQLFVDKKDWEGQLYNKAGDNRIEVPVGFNIRGYNGLEDAVLDPNFKNSTFLQKIILSLKEARQWLTQLFANIIFTLKSLNELVRGGIGLNLQNIGFMILILDIINSIKFIMTFENGLEPCDEDYEELIRRMRNSNPDLTYVLTPESNIEVTDTTWQTFVIDPATCQSYIKTPLTPSGIAVRPYRKSPLGKG